MNYWHMQLHPNDTVFFNKERIIKLLSEKSVIGFGEGQDGESLVTQFKDRMKIEDIVVIKQGETPIALVKVKGEYFLCDDVDHELDWFPHRRKVEVLDYYQNHYGFYIDQPRRTLSICKNLKTGTSQTIIGWYKNYMGLAKIEDSLSLLNFKKQIILQGPPGTGKTRLAKLIAGEIIKPKKIDDPEKKINNLVINFNSNSETNLNIRNRNQTLLSTFLGLFPKENLNELTLEKYATGNGEKDNFCWWIERGLQPLGYYFPGSSRTYLIYWKKAAQDYSKHGFVKDIEKNEDAMSEIAKALHDLVNYENISSAAQYFGNSFILKLLNTYYPAKYFPINSEKMLENALKIFKVENKGWNIFEKNKKLYEIYLTKKTELKSDVSVFEFAHLLSSNFNLKTGVDVNQTDDLIGQGEYQLIQFHPAYSYEDFVRGIVAETTENGNIKYKVENKVLAEFAQKAIDNPSSNFVLIIDEINRANLPSVLGELIYALEYRGEPVTSMYEFEGERNITLPTNLYIVGTMNTADRSVGHIDYAIRRRFAFVDILPDEIVINNIKARQLFNDVKGLFCNEYLSPDFKHNDVMIGHSYFLTSDKQNENELKMKLNFEIKPILREYVKDGVLLEIVAEKIEELNV